MNVAIVALLLEAIRGSKPFQNGGLHWFGLRRGVWLPAREADQVDWVPDGRDAGWTFGSDWPSESPASGGGSLITS